jgi:polyphosphate kinase
MEGVLTVGAPDRETAAAITSDSPARFINRELSWLAFNERVLEEAYNVAHPLFERLRFLSISANNLNEFYMVRVAGLRAQVEAGVTATSQDGLSPQGQLDLIIARAVRLMQNQQKCWRGLAAELRASGITVIETDEVTEADRAWLGQYFDREILPVLTPIAVDPAHPFPFLPNLGQALLLALSRPPDGKTYHALVPMPQMLRRFIRLPGESMRYITLERTIALHLDRLFPGDKVVASGLCRILRDGDLHVEEEAEDLVELYESAIRRRRRGTLIRVSVETSMPDDLRDLLIYELEAQPSDVVALDGQLGIADTKELITSDRPELVFPPYHPRASERFREYDNKCLDAIRGAKDILVHHPYESFDVVVEFVRQAAEDPNVVAIKQTLYRTSDDSPIVAALIRAAEAGKSVTALVEVKARFDEERNIRWSRALERAGVHVVYGFVLLKTHAKITLVVRREAGALRTYCHFGTGNYHPLTARIYTDLSYFTCDEALCRDAMRLFNFMTGTAPPAALEKLAFAPLTLRQTLIRLIEDEIAHARAGRPAAIWAKLNSLVDGTIIDALYRASSAGVSIDLVVRGICCLRPGVPSLSENIRVKSIVGRFLEHGRIVCLGAGHPLPSPHAKVFMSSADWMPRNLDGRVETLVPIEAPTVHRQILEEIMVANLRDEAQTWDLGPDGVYRRRAAAPGAFACHSYFMANPSLAPTALPR